ncbi:MFS transporter [Novosphingobium terrae]|uniref:MFS transporter n=1 Tax=Novosphingobium terrae TaxID=2726189 RepID=UPI001F135397|nr:MFS transporter [Novosphingobium terrae]
MNAIASFSETTLPEGMARGAPAYRHASLALFLAGFSTFSLLYCVQPLLPEFSRSFHIGPAESSLALSLTTGALALAIFAMGALSQALPRRPLMFASMACAALFNLLAGIAPWWPAMLGFRLLEGLALGGVPAVAMAYLAEEIHHRDLGRAMGLYVAGTAFGGMAGRVGMGVLTDLTSWRGAMIAISIADLAAAAGFALLLPASKRFIPHERFQLRGHPAIWLGHLRNPAMLRLFGVGFVLTSVFVTIFNYAGFRLSAAPYNLGQTAISMIFLTYISGMFTSSAAGQLADRIGRRLPAAAALALMGLGVAATMASALWIVILGILLVTIGFFAAHAIASGWVGRLAGPAKGHAASLYLLFYYLGSSVTGSVGGWFWQHLGWSGVAGLSGALALVGVVLTLTIREERAHG